MSISNRIREILGNLLMVEGAARLDNIKEKVAKRKEEIISRAECEKIVQICVMIDLLVK